jgi:dienelactone hydrolase
VVLAQARAGTPLAAVVTFHGSLKTDKPAKKGAIKTKLLVLHGADDPFVPADQVEAFQKEMKDAGADVKLIAYPGAKHAFTNPAATALGKANKLPIEYNAEADTKSWAEMVTFLKGAFGGK